MRRLTTILCSIAFMVSGIMMALSTSDQSPGTGYKSVAAATMQYSNPQPLIPIFSLKNDSTVDLSEDLVRDLARAKGVMDTVLITDTITRWRKAPAPKPVVKETVVHDTVPVLIYYIATRAGMKEGPDGECISVYEVHEVDKICPEINNSSGEPVIEQDCDVGE